MRTYLKVSAVVMGALAIASGSHSVVEKTAVANDNVCHSNPVGTLSTGHAGPTNVVGAFTQLDFYPDASQGVGQLTVLCQNTTTPVCTPVPVQMIRVGSSTRNYNVSIPCNATSQSLIPNSVCVNGMIANPTPKVVTKTTKGVTTTVTTYSAWVGKLVVSFDDDDDVLLAKLVNTSVLTGINNMCDPEWYVATATGGAPYCESNADCIAMMPPMAIGPAACSSSSYCYYDPPVPVVIPTAGMGMADGPPCQVDNDCLAYATPVNSCTTATGYGTGCKIFCSQADNAYTNSVGTCIYEVCAPAAVGAVDTRWCDPWYPNGTCNSTCNQ